MTHQNRSKSDLRNHFKSARRRITPHRSAELSGAILARMRTLPEFVKAHVIHSFWPSPALGEVDVRPLLREFDARGGTVILPVVSRFEPTGANPRLRHVKWSPTVPMRANRLGILEPEGVDADPTSADIVIVPALAADRNGFRIGFGMGYYDEFLAELTSVSVCPLFSESLINDLPIEDHDVPVNIIVTDEEIVRIATAGDIFR